MQVLDYLRELISFPSISSVSNVAVTDCVEQWLRQMHFETERISYQDARGVLKTSVVARRGPQSGSGLAWIEPAVARAGASQSARSGGSRRGPSGRQVADAGLLGRVGLGLAPLPIGRE